MYPQVAALGQMVVLVFGFWGTLHYQVTPHQQCINVPLSHILTSPCHLFGLCVTVWVEVGGQLSELALPSQGYGA